MSHNKLVRLSQLILSSFDYRFWNDLCFSGTTFDLHGVRINRNIFNKFKIDPILSKLCWKFNKDRKGDYKNGTLLDQFCRLHNVIWLGFEQVESRLSQTVWLKSLFLEKFKIYNLFFLFSLQNFFKQIKITMTQHPPTSTVF